MAIRNVNGRNVYVLVPKEPTGKTTSGKSWATLYSDLRWQVWEETQKNQAQMLKVELASAKQRKEYYDDKIKFLEAQRRQLQAAALKAQGGSTGSANSDALRAAQGLERMARQQAGQVVTTTKPVIDMFTGEPIPGKLDVSTRETAPTGGVDPRAKQVYESIVDSYLAGDLTEAEAQQAAQAAGIPATAEQIAGEKAARPSLDQEIERLDREIESLLGARQQAGLGVDGDLLTRTRRAFEADQGVIGRGGTAFGLAPRPRRTMARVDQPLAQERIDTFTQAALQEKQQREALEAKKLDLLLRKEEAMAVEGEMAGALVLDINRELDDIDSVLAQPSIVQRALQSEEFTPRRAGELLLRDRRADFVPPRETPVETPAGTVTAGEPIVEGAPAPVEPPRGMEELGLEGMSPEEKQALEEAVRAAGEITPKEEGEIGPAPEIPRIAPAPVERAFEEVPVPAAARRVPGEGVVGPAPERRLPTGEQIALDKDQAITNPDILDNPDFVPSRNLVEEARAYYRGMTIKKGNEKQKTIRFPQRYFGGEVPMVKEYLKDEIRKQAPVGVDVEEEVKAVDEGEPQTSNTRQRKDQYKMKVVAEGVRLAAKPKKLERLAKTQADPEDRPDQFVIVDKLYETNRGKADAFKMTYDEISRAFADRPDARREAHTYLVAKDTLESNIEEPLA